MAYHLRRFWASPYRRYWVWLWVVILSVLLLVAFAASLWLTPFFGGLLGYSITRIFYCGRDSVIYDQIESDSERS